MWTWCLTDYGGMLNFAKNFQVIVIALFVHLYGEL
jgi:hypothetical protein